MHKRTSSGRPWFRRQLSQNGPNKSLEFVHGHFSVSAAILGGRRKQMPRLLFASHIENAPPSKQEVFSKRQSDILELVTGLSISIEERPYEHLTRLVKHSRHQGVVLECSPREFDLDALTEPTARLQVVTLGVQDDMTFGAIARSCSFFVPSCVLCTSSDESILSPAALRASAGSLEMITVAQLGSSWKDVGDAIRSFHQKNNSNSGASSIIIATNSLFHSNEENPHLPELSSHRANNDDKRMMTLIVCGDSMKSLPPAIRSLCTHKFMTMTTTTGEDNPSPTLSVSSAAALALSKLMSVKCEVAKLA